MYRRNVQGWMKHFDFIMLDLVCLHIAFLLSFFVRHGLRNPYADNVYFSLLLFLSVMDVLISIFFNSFKNVLKRGYYNEFMMTARQVCLILMVATFYLFTIKSGQSISRTVIYLMGVCYGFFSYVGRLLWKKYLRKKLSGTGKRSLLIVTTCDRVTDVVNHIKQYSFEMFRIAGVITVDGVWEKRAIDGVAVMDKSREAVEWICRGWVDEAFIDIPQGDNFPKQLIHQLMEMGVVVHISLAEIFNPLGQKQFMERIGKYTVLTSSINYANAGQIFLKRMMDIIGGIIGCTITFFLTLIVGPMIYFRSPGPVFFAQIRVGKNGRKFKMYKFRSMYPDAEERKAGLLKENRIQDERMFKLEYDPRIIGCRKLPDGSVKKGIGNFLRDFSLDEFPQFWNVLKGEMSLVGTRPPTLDEWDKYDLHHRARLAVKPGITGLWQVSGRSSITDFEEVVELDSQYIAEWNIGMDIKICLKTLKVMFGREGAM